MITYRSDDALDRARRRPIPVTLAEITRELAGVNRFIDRHEHATDRWSISMVVYYRARRSVLQHAYDTLTGARSGKKRKHNESNRK